VNSTTPAAPAFEKGKRYTYVQANGVQYLYDFRGVKTRGQHKGLLHFQHRQQRNHSGDLYLKPDDPRLPHITPYVPHPASKPYIRKEQIV
jgi:hypothetical protein